MADKRTINRLTDRGVKGLIEPGRHADGGNLYLTVRPGGSRQWVFFFRWQGKLREMGLGSYPAVSLAKARQHAADARGQVANGVDPLDARRRAADAREKADRAAAGIPTFGEYAIALVGRIEAGFRNAKHRQQWRNTLKTYCGPIWEAQIDNVDAAGVLACLSPIWQSKPETAQRVRGRIEHVLSAAKAERLRSGENPAVWRGHLDKLLSKPGKLTRGHHAALPYAKMPAFMADLRARDTMAAMALEFAILTAARTGEVLGARWPEIDLDAGVWTIPGARMKAGNEHRVPLSARALEIVKGLAQTKQGEHVFPGQRPLKPLSSMAMLMLLRRMGRADVTAHGFRSAFSDWASEASSFSAELRETALAHTIANKAEAAYRRGDALKRRRAMMEAWAKWCEPKAASNVVAFAKSATPD
jgi:integrase